jgi:hypothetical protein
MSVGVNFGVDKEVAIYKAIFAKDAAPIRVRGYLFSQALPTEKSPLSQMREMTNCVLLALNIFLMALLKV